MKKKTLPIMVLETTFVNTHADISSFGVSNRHIVRGGDHETWHFAFLSSQPKRKNRYGSKMQNLKFVDASTMKPLAGWQKVHKELLILHHHHPETLSSSQAAYGLIQIGGPWLWDRLNRYSTASAWGDHPSESWQRRAWKTLTNIETTYKFLTVLNFLVFLVDGKYRSLIDRLLGLRLVYIHPNTARAVSFEWMNRQLVWHGFTVCL